MRKLLLLPAILLACCLATPSLVNASINPAEGGTGGNTLVAWSTNALSVTQSIADLGGGTWKYTFNISSAEQSKVWHFLTYASFTMSNVSASFPLGGGIFLPDSLAPYDATNIDPALTMFSNMWYTPFANASGDGLATGGMATLSYNASVYDPSAKLFAYETRASGYAGGQFGPGGGLDEKVHAFGYSNAFSVVPEPGTVTIWAVLGLAGLAIRRRKVA